MSNWKSWVLGNDNNLHSNQVLGKIAIHKNKIILKPFFFVSAGIGARIFSPWLQGIGIENLGLSQNVSDFIQSLIKKCGGHGGQVTIDIVWPSFDPEWRICGLAGRPIDPWYVPGSLCLNMRDTSPAEALLCSELSALFFCILFSVFYTSVSLSFAEWDWGLRPVIGGEGIAVSKVRLRRHSSTYTLLACLDLYRHWGSIYSDKRSLASRRHICTLYTYTDTHIHMLQPLFNHLSRQ